MAHKSKGGLLICAALVVALSCIGPTRGASEGQSSETNDSTPIASLKQHAASIGEQEQDPLLRVVVSQTARGDVSALEEMVQSGDPSYIPILVEFMRFAFRLNVDVGDVIRNGLESLLEKYSGPQSVGEDRHWGWWIEWIGQHPEVNAPSGYAKFKSDLYARLFNEEVGSFFYQGIKTRVRLEEVIWGGVDEDSIHPLNDAPVIRGDLATYLHTTDRVFGLVVDNQPRAYPHRILNLHEMANDVLGGVPIVLSY